MTFAKYAYFRRPDKLSPINSVNTTTDGFVCKSCNQLKTNRCNPFIVKLVVLFRKRTYWYRRKYIPIS
uniref:Uncharacterized protein n=1 Tax=Arundo donax TaxID=35708 RepID=A0A0A9E406_ARUDO